MEVPLPSPRLAGVIAGAVLLAVIGAGCGKTNAVHAGAKVWQSDPALAASLAPEINIGGFAMKPPNGFTVQRRSMTSRDGRGETCLFKGPAHPDGQRAQMFIMVGTDGGHMSGYVTPEQTTSMYVNKIATMGSNPRISDIQPGMIGDMPYARAYWSSVGKESGKTFHGAVYTASQSPDIVQVLIQDTEPYHKKNLALLEASALTLRKR